MNAMTLVFSKREIGAIVLGSLAVALTIAFDDSRKVFVLSFWLSNYAITFVLTLVALSLFALLSKYAAHRLQIDLRVEVWRIRRLLLRKKVGKKNLYFGVLLPVLIAFVTLGKVPFGASLQYTLETEPAKRMGRKFVHVTDFEQATIAVAGSICLMVIAILLKLFPFFSLADRFITILRVVSVSSLLPLPNLNGLRAYLGSTHLYLFAVVLVVLSAVLINLVASLVLVVILLFFALFMVILRYWYVMK